MKKILVIDDDKDLAEAIKAVLEYEGYVVLHSQSGREGIELAKKFEPQLILLDIMMPEMDGSDTLDAIKEEDRLKETPVVFLTGLVSEDDQAEGLNSINIRGVSYQSLAKPFENKKLISIVTEILEEY